MGYCSRYNAELDYLTESIAQGIYGGHEISKSEVRDMYNELARTSNPTRERKESVESTESNNSSSSTHSAFSTDFSDEDHIYILDNVIRNKDDEKRKKSTDSFGKILNNLLKEGRDPAILNKIFGLIIAELARSN